jgi:hypothetical protein
MPTRPSTNVVAKYLELPPELAAQVQAFADARGETFKAVVVHALRRHLAYPPPQPAQEQTEVLPDSPAATGDPKRSRQVRKKK